jgi:hypothetical protein
VDVELLEPKALAYGNEILTSRMRWHVVGLLEERLRDCSVVVVCDSPNYLRSWWTRMDLVLVAYRAAVGGRADPCTCSALATRRWPTPATWCPR